MNEFCKIILTNICFLFIFYLIGYSLYYLIISIRESIALRHFQKQKKFRNRLNHDYFIPISILLATYNDEKRIVRVLQSLLSLHYKLYEIIIIDDGSSDKTIQRLIQAFQLKKVEKPIRKQLQTKQILQIYQAQKENVKITLLKKEHGGFADAFNAGINASEYPYFICINSNFSLQEDALENLVRPVLEDEHVLVCTGVVRVGTMQSKPQRFQFPRGFLRKIQVLEYNRFSFLSKKNKETFGFPSFTLFQKKFVLSVVGFDNDAVGENFELIRKVKEYCLVHHEPYVLKGAPNAITFIEVPNSIIQFIKQRKSWNRGLSKNVHRYRKDVSLSCSIYEFYLPFIELCGTLALILSCILDLVDIHFVALFLGSYLLFCSGLSLCVFLFKLWTENTKLSFVNFITTCISSLMEVSLLKFLILIAKISSFFGKNTKSINVIE